MSETLIASDRQSWYDSDRGTLDRRVFSDPNIYQQELKQIFARAWNFVCHESQLKESGSFFMSYIGEDEIIAVRDRSGQVRVLLNSCAHRGNTVCRAEQGRTNSFLCSYHGWNYDLDGQLVGMPNEAEFYRNKVNKQALGLGKAAKVDSYKGFVFATMDASAPALSDFLGWVGRLGIDMLASQGELEVLDGIVKNRLQCNWKIAVDNLYDWYHVKVSHGTALRAGFLPEKAMAPMHQMVMLGEYGHGIGGPGISEETQRQFDEKFRNGEFDSAKLREAGNSAREALPWYVPPALRRLNPEMRKQLGPVGTRSYGHPNIFPNLWIALTNQICLRIPRGLFETELWWFTLLPKEMPDDVRRSVINAANHTFGPAGMLEQDDGENWSHSTRGAKGFVTQNRPVDLSMGMGEDEVINDPSGQSRIETVVNEHGQRWNYQSWQDWMSANSWEDLINNHSQTPTGLI